VNSGEDNYESVAGLDCMKLAYIGEVLGGCLGLVATDAVWRQAF